MCFEILYKMNQRDRFNLKKGLRKTGFKMQVQKNV